MKIEKKKDVFNLLILCPLPLPPRLLSYESKLWKVEWSWLFLYQIPFGTSFFPVFLLILGVSSSTQPSVLVHTIFSLKISNMGKNQAPHCKMDNALLSIFPVQIEFYSVWQNLRHARDSMCLMPLSINILVHLSVNSVVQTLEGGLRTTFHYHGTLEELNFSEFISTGRHQSYFPSSVI